LFGRPLSHRPAIWRVSMHSAVPRGLRYPRIAALASRRRRSFRAPPLSFRPTRWRSHCGQSISNRQGRLFTLDIVSSRAKGDQRVGMLSFQQSSVRRRIEHRRPNVVLPGHYLAVVCPPAGSLRSPCLWPACRDQPLRCNIGRSGGAPAILLRHSCCGRFETLDRARTSRVLARKGRRGTLTTLDPASIPQGLHGPGRKCMDGEVCQELQAPVARRCHRAF
jgi:hypothetical protein